MPRSKTMNRSKTAFVIATAAFLLVCAPSRADEAQSLKLLVSAIDQAESPQVREALIRGMLDGLEGRRNVQAPSQWQSVSAKLMRNEDPSIRELTQRLSQIFGDRKATAQALAILKDDRAKPSARRSALHALLMQRNEAASDYLEALLDHSELSIDAIRGYTIVENPTAPALLLENYARFSEESKRAVLETLATRKPYAEFLVDAMEAGTVSPTEIPTHVARALEGILGKRFVEVFGKVPELTQDREKLLAKYKTLLTPENMDSADASRGRAVYQKTCAACHLLYGEGGKIGPDLTGSNRANLDYILLNSVDPSYDVPEAYRMVQVLTVDGRVINGVLAAEDESRIVLKTVEQPEVVVAKNDIATRKLSDKSMMPEGQLEAMSKQDIIDLISYLRTTQQVELAK